MLRLPLALVAPVAVAASLAVAVPAAAALSEVRVTELRPLGGDAYTEGWGINDRGEAVGLSTPADGAARAVLWHGGTSQWVGPDGFSPGKINNAGQVVGNLATGNGGSGAAVVQGGTTAALADPRNGYASSAAGLNDAGKVIGTAYRDGRLRAVAWQAGEPRWLPDWGLGSHASDVNAAGAIAGDVLTDDGTYRPVAWGPADGLRELPVPSWGTGGSALAVNDAGLIAGTIHASQGLDKPVVWLDAGVRSLPLLTDGTNGTPWDANDAGLIVGTADDAESRRRAVLWQDGHVRDLNDLLPADSGWMLEVATGVNEGGQIVGQGYLNGQPRGYVLDLSSGDGGGGSSPPAVPLPPTAGMVLCAGPLLWVGRRVVRGR